MHCQVLDDSENSISLLCNELRQGGVVAIPTETVYGLAGDAFQEIALGKIFATKERPHFDPLILHVKKSLLTQGKTLLALDKTGIVESKLIPALLAQKIEKLIESFWPGPLTLVLPKKKNVPDLATSGLTTVAVRMPSHPLTQRLLEAFPNPLAAPSANRFGRISPTTAAHVVSEIGDRIPFVFDGGTCVNGLESTILYPFFSPESGKPSFALLRPGALPKEEIEKIVGPLSPSPLEKKEIESSHVAPGMLASHYAPRKPLFLCDSKSAMIEPLFQKIMQLHTHVGILQFSTPTLSNIFSECPNLSVLTLSERGDDQEAARQLFAFLRTLDESRATVIVAEPCPFRTGLGLAINDRLKRASTSGTKLLKEWGFPTFEVSTDA